MTITKLPDPATTFARRHIGPSPRDVEAMLEAVGAKSLAALMDQTLPASIRQRAPLDRVGSARRVLQLVGGVGGRPHGPHQLFARPRPDAFKQEQDVDFHYHLLSRVINGLCRCDFSASW